MSGGVLPLFTNVNPTPLWGLGGGAGTVSSFSVASVSSLTASTIVVGNVVASQVQSAIDRSALFYTSSLSGSSAAGTSTLLYTLDPAGGVSITGTYFTNINLATSAVNAAPQTAAFTVGLSGNGSVAVTNPLVTNGTATYDISPSVSGNIVSVYLANNGALSPPFSGTFTRIGF